MDERYTEKVLDHFRRPRNVGELEDADGVALVGGDSCGDVLKVWINVQDDRIAAIRFQTTGCPAVIATSSMMTELAQGKTLDEAAEITDEVIAGALGGLPPDQMHCANMGATVLYDAIMNHVFRTVEAERMKKEVQNAPV